MMAARYLRALGLDKCMSDTDSTAHILELATKRRDDICRLIVLFTLSGKTEAWDAAMIERRAAAFVASVSAPELVMLLTMVLKQPDLKGIYRECGIQADLTGSLALHQSVRVKAILRSSTAVTLSLAR